MSWTGPSACGSRISGQMGPVQPQPRCRGAGGALPRAGTSSTCAQLLPAGAGAHPPAGCPCLPAQGDWSPQTGQPPEPPWLGRNRGMGSRGHGVVEPSGEKEQTLPWEGSLPDPPRAGGCGGVSGQVSGAPDPLHPPGSTCRPGLLVWKALHACRTGKSVPVPEPGPPHAARARGSPQSAFVPALERMDWRQPGSSVSRRHRRPRGSGRGKGDRWRDRRMEPTQGWPALAKPAPVPASRLGKTQPLPRSTRWRALRRHPTLPQELPPPPLPPLLLSSSLTRGNFLARHNSSEKFMAHRGGLLAP